MDLETVLENLFNVLNTAWENGKEIVCHLYYGSNEILTCCVPALLTLTKEEICIHGEDDTIVTVDLQKACLEYDEFDNEYYIKKDNCVFVIGSIA